MCDEKTDYVSYEEYNFNPFSAKYIITRYFDCKEFFDELNIRYENNEFITFVS